jgi:hypothetical protein
MINEVKCLLLLAKVYKSHKKEEVMETLNLVTGQGLYFLMALEGAGLQALRLCSLSLHLCPSVMANLRILGWAGREEPEVRCLYRG